MNEAETGVELIDPKLKENGYLKFTYNYLQ